MSRQLKRFRITRRWKVKIPKAGKQLKMKDNRAVKMIYLRNPFYSPWSSAQLSILLLTNHRRVMRASLMLGMESIKVLMYRVLVMLVLLISNKILN